MPQGSHFCSLPRTFREQFSTATPFLAAGAAAGQKCLFVADDNPVMVARAELRARGLAVEELEARGRLQVVASVDTPLHAKPLEAQRLYRVWEEAVDAALAAGFTGLRVVVEMTWALDQGLDALARYEAGSTRLFETRPLHALCQYNYNLFSSEQLKRAAIRSHPGLLLEGGRAAEGPPEFACRLLGLCA